MFNMKSGDSSAQNIVKLWNSLSDGIVDAESSREFSKWFLFHMNMIPYENMENMHGKICKDDFCLKRTVNRKLLEVRSISERSTSAFILLWTLIVGCQRCFWLDGILVWTAVWLQSLLSLKTRAGDIYFFYLGPFGGLFYTIAETDLLS